ncbi:hypothetical protein Fcan01_10734 [Folsomia candida]|uniref:Gustatory receptor n=1 Tax=Folsomia candida TaxID=158441 RepID=A0A226EE80_FOLCA|nr:hypothetical protein Fcan01_10734 [Folsomia candida]
MKSPISPERSLDCEELLLKWAKWPLLGVQFNGYLSLSVTPRKFENHIKSRTKECKKSLQFNFLSIPFIFHLLFITICPVLAILWGNENFGAYVHLRKVSSDAVIMASNMICGFSYTIGNRIWSLLCSRKHLAFWTYQVNKIALLTPNLWDPNIVLDLQNKIRTSFFRTAFFLPVIVFSLFVSNFIFVDILQISNYGIMTSSYLNQSKPVVIIGLLGTYCIFSHGFFSIWLNFFVKMYSAALVDHFNDRMGRRIVLEVGFNLIYILVATYFAIVAGKMGDLGAVLTTIMCTLLSMHVLYAYGNDGEDLEVARVKLMKLLCEVEEREYEIGVANKILKFRRKVTTCTLRITPENFFTLDRSFILSILSILMTLLIVLAQFRDSEVGKVGIN